MLIISPEGTSTEHWSERTFLGHVRHQPGVLLANLNVPNSSTPGAFTREVDAVVLTPQGVCTVEVKGLRRAVGVLTTSRMDAWSVVDGESSVALQGRPHAQALTQSKYLSSFLKDMSVPVGWVSAVLALVGDDIALPEGAEVLLTENVHVVVSGPAVGQVLAEQVLASTVRQELSVETVQQVFAAFECVVGAPSVEALCAEGFRTEAQIAADVATRRQQVRDEFFACGGVVDVATPQGAEPLVETAGVAEGPSATEWRVTPQRFAAASALDAELTETAAFVDGVAMHRRLVSYASRKGVSLEAVAAVVNEPVEVWGDASETNQTFVGEVFVVTVRSMDGLAMYYKDRAQAVAEREGATVSGVAMTANAAKQAVGKFGISLAALARVVTMPEERWFMPGTTNVAHARGEIVAVTAGPVGEILYVQSRAMAVMLSQPKVIPEPEAAVADLLTPEFTMRAAAVSWCRRRNVDTAVVVALASHPDAVWAGHSDGMEVRAGVDHAVLMDTQSREVVAVMSRAEAEEYRDGVMHEGVHVSGRCLFLSRRRKTSLADLTSAVTAPTLIARAPGATESVFVGETLAVTVTDEPRSVVDFTYPGHARSLVERGVLVSVDVSGEGVEVRKVSPAVFASIAGAGMTKPVPSPVAPVLVAPVLVEPVLVEAEVFATSVPSPLLMRRRVPQAG